MQRVCPMLCRHLWPLWLHNIFRHYLINGTIFGIVLLNIKCVLIFSTTFIWNISHSKKNWARYYHKRENVFKWSTRHSSRIWIKLEFSRQIFEKYPNIKFHQNPSSESGVVPCDGRTDMTELTVAFPNFSKASKKTPAFYQPDIVASDS
jgi:hypothetical protein